MKLVLVESPTKARKIAGYLGAEFVVRASLGHVRDLPKSRMGVDVEHDFAPEYTVPREKTALLKELKPLAARAEQVILATDPDREGEAIGWHLREILGDKTSSIKQKKNTSKSSKNIEEQDKFVRASFHEITKPAVMAAIAHPAQLQHDLVDAQQARRVLDRLVGYTLSPVLWKKIRAGLSAGRVQSVALRLIVEREREIAAFVPEEYWELDVILSKEKVSQDDAQLVAKALVNHRLDVLPAECFAARVITVQDKEFAPHSEKDILAVGAFLPDAAYQVASIEKKERRRASLPPLTTSTLQQQAANRLGYTSKATMRFAQGLYEEGHITYHRTDSVNLAPEAVAMARAFIQKTFGPQFLPDQPRYFANKSKNAQEAHEAIRPTHAEVTPESLAGKLSPQESKLYDLIWRRFVASQMAEAVFDQTTVLIDAIPTEKTSIQAKEISRCGLKANGSVMKSAGWMKLFPNSGDAVLPELVPQQSLLNQGVHTAQKFTQPPARYNDASLIKVLEQEGIGRPSTYASIISVIEDRGYVERQDRRFLPTTIGFAVNDFLQKYFSTIVDYQFTAKLEDDLDAIARGEINWVKVLHQFYDPFAKTVAVAQDNAERMPIPVEKTGEQCPKCGATEKGEVVIRTGKYGKFRSCSRFPDCDFTEAIVNKIADLRCPLCQEGDVIEKPSRYGKAFYGCSRYPACTWASWKKPELGMRVSAEEWAVQQAERAAKKAARTASHEAKYGKKPPAKKKAVKKKKSPKAKR